MKAKAVIECYQPIPCNPCEEACPRKAITVGHPITNLPQFRPELCTGCGLCVVACPGLAIFLVDTESSPQVDYIALPHERLPLPAKGETGWALDRDGKITGEARVVDVKLVPAFNRTALITLEVPKGTTDKIRAYTPTSTVELSSQKPYHSPDPGETANAYDQGRVLICRCEEVTRSEIEESVRDGARDLDGVKRRTRAGMGLCQGRTCSRLVAHVIAEVAGIPLEEVPPLNVRPPIRPIEMGALAGDEP